MLSICLELCRICNRHLSWIFLHTSFFPFMEAACNAVHPLPMVPLMSAPFATSHFTKSTLPSFAAWNRIEASIIVILTLHTFCSSSLYYHNPKQKVYHFFQTYFTCCFLLWSITLSSDRVPGSALSIQWCWSCWQTLWPCPLPPSSGSDWPSWPGPAWPSSEAHWSVSCLSSLDRHHVLIEPGRTNLDIEAAEKSFMRKIENFRMNFSKPTFQWKISVVFLTWAAGRLFSMEAWKRRLNSASRWVWNTPMSPFSWKVDMISWLTTYKV